MRVSSRSAASASSICGSCGRTRNRISSVPRAPGSPGDRTASALTELAEALELPEPPHRIECYDISNIQGTNPVASMVVFVEGRPKKSDYRHFNIQAVKGPNDFAMMQETLRRRLRYLRQEADRPPVADGDAATTAIEAQARKTSASTKSPTCC